jgi:hypothetical protein
MDADGGDRADRSDGRLRVRLLVRLAARRERSEPEGNGGGSP